MISKIKLNNGNFLFRYRGIIPIPFIILSLLYYYSSSSNPIPESHYIFCLIISIIGILIRFFAVGFAFYKTSGKNTKKQIAEKLNTTGAYSIVRNPLYIANYLNWLGVILLFSNYIITIITSFFFVIIYYKIVLVEEKFLSKK